MAFFRSSVFIRLHPGALVESEGTMDRSQAQAQRQVQLQIPIVEHVVALVAEVGDQLFNLCWRNTDEAVLVLLLDHHALGSQRKCIVGVV